MTTGLHHETKIPMRGDLRVVRRSADDNSIISVWDKQNVITFAGTYALIKLMAPNAAFGSTVQIENQLKSMRFGTSNVSPQRVDIALASEAAVLGTPIRIVFGDANRITDASGTVEFTATMAAGYGNGVTYREAALFTRGTADDPLVATGAVPFSRQVFSDQPKTAAVVLEFRWRLTLTV